MQQEVRESEHVDVRSLKDVERFRYMDIGDPYVGKFQFLNEQQGLEELDALEHFERRRLSDKRRYEA